MNEKDKEDVGVVDYEIEACDVLFFIFVLGVSIFLIWLCFYIGLFEI